MVKLKINGPEKALIGNLFVSFRFYFMVVAGISTFLFLSLVFSISCNENQVTDEQILTEIFPQLVDSIGFNRSNLVPPPVALKPTTDSTLINLKIEEVNDVSADNEQTIRWIDSVDSRLLIGLVDTCLPIDFGNLNQKSSTDSLVICEIISIKKNFEKSTMYWNIDQIKPPGGLQLMSKSDLMKRYTDIWNVDDRKFGGLIAVSRIIYNSERKIGLFRFDTYPSFSQGESYFVMIEFIDGKWTIKRLILNWII